MGRECKSNQSDDIPKQIQPDMRVPLNRDTVTAMFLEGEDLVLQYAIEALQAP